MRKTIDDWALATAAGAYAMFMIAVLVLSEKGTVGEMGSDQLAAWAQAGGGMLAVLAAIWIPLRIRAHEHREARTERRVRAQAVALAVYPDVLEMKARAAGVLKRLSTIQLDEISLSAPICGDIQLPIPDAIQLNYDNLYLLGKSAGGSVIQLVSVCGQLNRIMANKRGTINLATIRHYPEMALKLCEEIKGAIMPAHDAEWESLVD